MGFRRLLVGSVRGLQEMTMINRIALEHELLPRHARTAPPPRLRAHACVRGTRQTAEGAIVRPAKAGAFSGRQSHRGKSRSPVAWVAGLQWGNRDSEAYRQRHRKDGGESPGRSASEREVASKLWPRRPSWQWLRRRQHGSSRTDRSDGTLRRGGYRRHGDKDVLSNWRDPPRPGEKSTEQGRPYNRYTGKAAEGERESDGSIVASKRGNARGAKGPCCL